MRALLVRPIVRTRAPRPRCAAPSAHESEAPSADGSLARQGSAQHRILVQRAKAFFAEASAPCHAAPTSLAAVMDALLQRAAP